MHPCADHPVDPNGDTAPAAGGYVGWPVSPGHLPDPHRDMDQGRVAIFFKPLIWFEILNCLYKVKMFNLLWANIPDLAMKKNWGLVGFFEGKSGFYWVFGEVNLFFFFLSNFGSDNPGSRRTCTWWCPASCGTSSWRSSVDSLSGRNSLGTNRCETDAKHWKYQH